MNLPADVIVPFTLTPPLLWGWPLVVLLAVVIAVEVVVLRLRRWDTWPLIVRDVTLVNVVSTAVGLGIARTGAGGWVPLHGFFIVWILGLPLSIVIEGLVLGLLARGSRGWRRIAVDAVLINMASYALLGLIDFVPGLRGLVRGLFS